MRVAPSLPPTAAIDVAPQLTKAKDTANAHYTPSLSVTVPWNPAGFYVPTGAQLNDGRVMLKLVNSNTAGQRALGFDRANGPVRWSLQCVMPTAWNLTPENSPTWRGRLALWFTVPHVLGEMPLHEGATIVVGPSRTRILGFARTNETIDRVFLEVRDARPGSGDGIHALQRPNYGSDWVDAYFRLDRAHHEAALEWSEVIGAVAMHSLLITNEQVHLTARETDRDVTLAIVRFERVREFEQPIVVHGLKWEEPR
jgi:hypothetical protein